MKRYELTVGNTTYHLKATDRKSAREEAQEVVDIEKSPKRQELYARSEHGVTAILREISDLQSYPIRAPTPFKS